MENAPIKAQDSKRHPDLTTQGDTLPPPSEVSGNYTLASNDTNTASFGTSIASTSSSSTPSSFANTGTIPKNNFRPDPNTVNYVGSCHQIYCAGQTTQSHLNVMNLSSQPLTPVELEDLSLGLGFCPKHILDKFNLIKDLYLFVRKLCLKVSHHRDASGGERTDPLTLLSKSQCRELRELLLSDLDSPEVPIDQSANQEDLIDLIDLEEYLNLEDPLKPSLEGLRKKYDFFPSPTISPNANLFFMQVVAEMITLIIERTPPSNLTQAQSRALEKLKTYKHLTIKASDEGGNIELLDLSI